MTDATKQWSYNTGERGRNWVRAYEERKTGILYLDWLEGPEGDRRRRRRSLGHRDRETAKAEADAKAAKLATAEPTNSVPETRTLGELFDNYLETEPPPTRGRASGATTVGPPECFSTSTVAIGWR